MPHLILEYSAGLDDAMVDATLGALGDAAAETGVMQRQDIKLRAAVYRHFRLLDGGASFAHLNVRLLAGRSPQQKRMLSEALRACLVAQLPEVHSLSVDIIDMDAEAYKKRLLAI